MTKHKNKFGQGKSVRVILLALLGLGLLIAGLMHGRDIVLFSPKGLIAHEQSNLMIFSTLVLLAVAVPTLIIFYAFAWEYRESNKKASHDPHTRHGKFFLLSLWVIPAVVVLVLTSVMWPATHELDPHKAIAADAKPLTIQVIAMRWKWLFIYPEQNIATVNFVQIPTATPVQFELTADEAPMSSFWIPHLGGQLYAMTGHDNRLNLMADTPGDYSGRSAEINGSGFADMKFIARASSEADFDSWAQGVEESPNVLDAAEYKRLLAPSENSTAVSYSAADSGLFDSVLAKYGAHNHTEQE